MDVPIKLKCGHNILVQPMFANLKTFMCRICDDIRFGCCDVCGVVAAITLGKPEPFYPVGKAVCFGCASEVAR